MRHIYGFNALRAFSISLVIASHTEFTKIFDNSAWNTFFHVFNAEYGVHTFFVLSGFLITTLLIKERHATGTVSIKNFIIRRALRILPIYFAALALIAVLVILRIAKVDVQAYGFASIFIFNFIPRHANVNYFSHLWSLSVEEQFYILWPLIFCLLFVRRAVLVSFCLFIILLCYWRLSTMGVSPIAKEYYLSRWTIPAIAPIMIGCIIAILVDWANAAQNYLAGIPVLIGSIVLIGLPLYFPMTPAVQLASMLGIATLMMWIYLNQHRRAVHRLDWGPIGYIGMISYGLYLWQGIFTGNGYYRDAPSWPPQVWVGVLITFAVAPLSYHFYERPILRLKKKWEADRLTTHRQPLPKPLIQRP